MPHRSKVLKSRVLQSKTESLRLNFQWEMPLILSLEDSISTGIKLQVFYVSGLGLCGNKGKKISSGLMWFDNE